MVGCELHGTQVPPIRIRYDLGSEEGSVMEKVCRVCGAQTRYLIGSDSLKGRTLSLEEMLELVTPEFESGWPRGYLAYVNSDYGSAVTAPRDMVASAFLEKIAHGR
jgi:hypothetical protein